jgi:ankyrin repeat protein
MFSITNKHQAAAELLNAPTAAAGALDMQNDTDHTALMRAAQTGPYSVVDRRITAGAKSELMNKGGMTALALACVAFGNTCIVL